MTNESVMFTTVTDEERFEKMNEQGSPPVLTGGWTRHMGKAVQFLVPEGRDTHAEGFGIHENISQITHILMAQMTAKKGIAEFGDRAIEAIIKEYDQLDKKKAFLPRSYESLKPQERHDALRSITLVSEKRSGRIKGRTVADGRPQRKYTAPEDVHSPTVSTEGLMTSLAIDAKERRYVVTADVEGAYLHANMDETVIMMFDDDMVDYMVETNPEKYGPHVHINKYGKKRLYVQLLKALYGCMQSAMLWWKLLTSTLVEEGFVVNPYDPC
eukprot:scaffold3660_cov147-Cylindrotheca_fusiformis.AAC.1